MFMNRIEVPGYVPPLRPDSRRHPLPAYAAVVLLTMAAITVLNTAGLALACPGGVAEACTVAQTRP